jgi:hypothetical protein
MERVLEQVQTLGLEQVQVQTLGLEQVQVQTLERGHSERDSV